jgi:hypothetical protein
VGGGERTSGSVVANQRGHAASVTRKGPRRKWFFRSLFFCDNRSSPASPNHPGGTWTLLRRSGTD